jgi:Domain of unknown function (DUF4062)/NACHT domain
MNESRHKRRDLVVMISSTAWDLPEHRKQLLQACLDAKMRPVMMENLAASDDTALEASLRMVDEADIYLLVLGYRYGACPRDKHKSYTHLEYEHARDERKMPRVTFIMSKEHPVLPEIVETGSGAESLKEFKATIRAEEIVKEFSSPEELRALAVHALFEQRDRLKTSAEIASENSVINQFFDAPGKARLGAHYISFDALIADKTEGFVGRSFVFDAIDAYTKQEESGYFLLQGEPGIGKTAVLAQLVRKLGCAHHFNIALQNVRTVQQFLGNACAQVIARYNLSVETIPSHALESSVFLVQCLEEAAKKDANRPVVLVVDALDEADPPNTLFRQNVLLLPPSLPANVFIVASSRPTDDLHLQVSRQKSLFIEPNSERNLLDVTRLIEDRLKHDEQLAVHLSAMGLRSEAAVKFLVDKSEGNFIYLRFVLPEIANGVYRTASIDDLPQGLKAYYQGHWNQMRLSDEAEFDQVYAPIVCLLAVAREPLTADQISEWTKIDRRKVRRAFTAWRQFLTVEGKAPASYRIYHRSFQEFLRDIVDLSEFDSLISDYYLRQVTQQ